MIDDVDIQNPTPPSDRIDYTDRNAMVCTVCGQPVMPSTTSILAGGIALAAVLLEVSGGMDLTGFLWTLAVVVVLSLPALSIVGAVAAVDCWTRRGAK